MRNEVRPVTLSAAKRQPRRRDQRPHERIRSAHVRLRSCHRGLTLWISATFFDREGVPSLVIADNEWRCRANVWDLTVEGRVIEIRQAKSALGLRLRTAPPSLLAIERLRMRHKDIGFEIDSDGRAILEYGDATRVEMESNRSVGADAVYTLP